MAKRGRKSKYESNVEPHLEDIPKLRKQGMNRRSDERVYTKSKN